jgi:hypothetical protein
MSAPFASVEPYAGRMDDRSRTTTAMLTELADRMRGRVVDGIRIHDARAVLDWGAGNELVVILTAVVDDPAPGLPTWPLDALRTMDRLAEDEAARIGIEEWVYVHRRTFRAVEDGRLPRRHGR